MSTQLRLVLVLIAAAGSACSDGPADHCDGVTLGQDSISIEENKSGIVTVTVPTAGGDLYVLAPEAPLTASFGAEPGRDAAGEHTLTIGCTAVGSGRVSAIYDREGAPHYCPLDIDVTCTEAPPGGGSFANGTYDDVDGEGPIAFLGAPWLQIVQAGSFGSMIFDVLRLEILLALTFHEVAAVALSANGNPTAIFGFPGLKFSVDTGSGYPVPTVLDTDPVRDIVPVRSTSARVGGLRAAEPLSTSFCALFEDKTIDCYRSVGDGFELDPASGADANFITPCDSAVPPIGPPKALAVAGDYALVLEDVGNVCHGQLGPGNQATQALAFVTQARDMSCPTDGAGNAPVCAIATNTSLIALSWPSASAPPTEGVTIETCGGARKIDGLRTADGTETCFALACPTESVVEEVCLTTATGQLSGHRTIAMPGCNGRYAAYASDSQIGVACPSSVRIFDRADMTPR